jgi:uncharacterized protein (TIGR02598 family)
MKCFSRSLVMSRGSRFFVGVPGGPRQGAFSLVEVTMALGIIAFSMITMLGLVPVGLDAMRESRVEMVRSQILQNITGRAMLTPFSELDSFVAGTYWFDDQGLAQAQRNDATRFIVTLDRSSTSYPGSARAINLPASVTTLKLHVQSTPGNAPAIQYVAHVPNQGG